ncbi:MAG: RNA polymerase sigma factor [Elusimicrobiota bacterium]
MQKDDDKLIEEYLKGDERAFKELFERYKTKLYPYLISLCLDKDLAEDIFQETFVKISEKLPSYKKENKFSSWIFTIARNIFLDKKKSAKEKFLNSSLAFENSEDEVSPQDYLSESGNPHSFLEAENKAKALSAAMEKLSEEQREIIALRHFAGLSFKEISENLNIPIGTALARFSRGLDKLRESLKDMQ